MARTSWKPPGRDPVLLLIDMQAGFDDPAWGPRNNPALDANVAALLSGWRGARAPVIHIHHDSPARDGLLRRGTPANAARPGARPWPGERVWRKRVNSAFIGTGLEAELRAMGSPALVIAGLTTNHCVSTTARMAANLGFRTSVVADAAAAFARTHIDGRIRTADEVHDAALSDLRDEFADIIDTWTALAVLSLRDAAHA